MRQSNINWTEEKWAKLNKYLDMALKLIENNNDDDSEDFRELVHIVRRKVLSKIDWEQPHQARLNQFYHVIKVETHAISRYTDVNLNKVFYNWWS